jgi:hypothetical protein
MNSLASTSSSTPWLKRLALPLVLVAAVVLLAYEVTGFFRLGRDARCLRNSLTHQNAPAPLACKKQFELSVGPISFLLLRSGLSLAPLDPNVRTALESVRGAEVGIYKLNAAADPAAFHAALATADQAMSVRGWDRVVGVGQGRELVVIYAPQRPARGARVDVCLAVVTRDQLVVVSGRTDLEPLMALALNQARKEPALRSWTAARL